jgi:hypothetical protein
MEKAQGGQRCRGVGSHTSAERADGGRVLHALHGRSASSARFASMVGRRALPKPWPLGELRADRLHDRWASSARATSMTARQAPRGLPPWPARELLASSWRGTGRGGGGDPRRWRAQAAPAPTSTGSPGGSDMRMRSSRGCCFPFFTWTAELMPVGVDKVEG